MHLIVPGVLDHAVKQRPSLFYHLENIFKQKLLLSGWEGSAYLKDCKLINWLVESMCMALDGPIHKNDTS